MAENRQELNRNLAQMLKGGVIMDVTTPEQAKIAEAAGACAVMALERIPADIRAAGGVSRMSDPKMIKGIHPQHERHRPRSMDSLRHTHPPHLHGMGRKPRQHHRTHGDDGYHSYYSCPATCTGTKRMCRKAASSLTPIGH